VALRNKLWTAFLAATSFVVVMWDFPIVRRTLGVVSGIDFIYEKADWWGKVAHMALNPPPGTALLVVIVGLVLIYWSTKPKETRMSWPVLGMLVSVLCFAGFGVWYLVNNQSAEKSKQDANAATTPNPDDTSRPSMLSGRPVSGLEMATRLERLEKEHASTVSELAAAKQQLAAKKPEVVPVPDATKQPTPPYYARAEIDAMLTSLGELDRFFRPKPVPSEAIQGMTRQVRGFLVAPDIAKYPSIADGLEQYAQQLRNDEIEVHRIVKDSDEFVRSALPDKPDGPNVPLHIILVSAAEFLKDVAGKTKDTHLAGAAIRAQQQQVLDEFTKYAASIQSTKQRIADKVKDLRSR
jgi:hypothetical protein